MSNRIKRLDNRGSALLTVVLVVTFLTILATILMYISGLNFQIKEADYRNKKSFYEGEKGTEAIKVELMKDVSDAAFRANQDLSINFANITSADTRKVEYNKYFVGRLQEVFDDKLLAYGGSWNALLASYMPNSTDYVLTMDLSYDADGNGVLTSNEVLEVNETSGSIILRGVSVKYTNPKYKLVTKISTDFRITAPAFDWSDAVSRTTLETGVSLDEAKTKDMISPADCVIYTEWKKE
ncbi:MAG: hypothetical protein E7292_05140 [Lachnospiraceae bacterium]|nr:hypothetical protein [Lachnospiraceae bacterium]